jgi:hypothetical protein
MLTLIVHMLSFMLSVTIKSIMQNATMQDVIMLNVGTPCLPKWSNPLRWSYRVKHSSLFVLGVSDEVKIVL